MQICYKTYTSIAKISNIIIIFIYQNKNSNMKKVIPIKDRHKRLNKKAAYASAKVVLDDQYNRNVLSLEEYKFQIEFNKGRYGIK